MDNLDDDLKTGDVLLQIRGALQVDGVKLWLPPYYDESEGKCDQELQVTILG